jgi:hypothetical protein
MQRSTVARGELHTGLLGARLRVTRGRRSGVVAESEAAFRQPELA